MLKVGASQINITPELPFPLAGSWHLRVATRVNDPLFSSCVVLYDGESSLTFISCDLIGISNEQVAKVRTQISKATGMAPQNIIVSCTHTHQGPIVRTQLPAPWVIKPDENLIEKVLSGIIESAIKANKNRQPARVGYGKGKSDKATFHRRYIMSDGHSLMHPDRGDNLDRLLVEGPADPEVQVVWFEDSGGNYIAVLVNFSSHATTLYDNSFVSADFPGAMRGTIQQVLGNNIPILYLQGACGNTCQIDVENEKRICSGIEGWRRVGRMLAGEVIKILAENYVLANENTTIAVKNRILSIPPKEISSEQVSEAKKRWKVVAEEDKKPKTEVTLPSKLDLERQLYHDYSTMELYKIRRVSPYFPVELSIIRLDDILFVTNPAELFVEFQLEIKKTFKENKIIIVELTNGWCGYVPTRLAIALGGYGTEISIAERLAPEAGEIIVNNSIELIRGINLKQGY